jgi:acetamidase/formamidase
MRHTFHPSHYFTTMGSHPPVLRLQPGDHVVTTTVCAAGRDATDAPVTPPPNPMTGPFFVEGAQPGDALVVTLHRITPNRPLGWSGSALADNVVDPDAVPTLPRPRKGAGVETIWQVDVAANSATVALPENALRDLSLPLAPMIGCFGVAPTLGQTISTDTSAEHGGNMDWRGFTAGVTVRFPVFVEGALFFLGDVHARQGHGEIAGTGIEISAEVEFSVDLLKAPGLRWPQAEDADFFCTLGSARPLDQALQHATTEMARLLEQTYALDARAVQTLMGQVVEFEIGNVFDPAYTVVCKMPRALLARLPLRH